MFYYTTLGLILNCCHFYCEIMKFDCLLPVSLSNKYIQQLAVNYCGDIYSFVCFTAYFDIPVAIVGLGASLFLLSLEAISRKKKSIFLKPTVNSPSNNN